MDPVGSTIVVAILTGLILPAASAFLFARRHKLTRLMTSAKEIAISVVDKNAHEQAYLKRDCDHLKKSMTNCQLKLTDARAQAKRVNKPLRSLRTRLDALEHRIKRKPTNLQLKKSYTKLGELLSPLESEHQRNLNEIVSLTEKLTDLKCEYDAVYFKYQACTTKLSNDWMLRQSEASNSRLESIRALDRMSIAEANVQKKEEALNLRERDRVGQILDADRVKIDKFVSKLPDIRGALEFAVDSLATSVETIIVNNDPSIERAYRRLLKQLETARALASHSTEAEEGIESQIGKHQDRANVWQERATLAQQQGNEQLAEQAILRKNQYETASKELQLELTSLKKRNLSANQILFRAERVVHRLYVIKLLLGALPGSKQDECSQFKNLADTMYKHLKDTLLGVELKLDPPSNFANRVVALEERTLMAYIKIAKGQPSSLPLQAATKLREDVYAISTSIDLERCDAQFEFDKWHNLKEQAEADNRNLLQLVASQRSEQCAELLKSTERSLEVLNVTLMLLEQRAVS